MIREEMTAGPNRCCESRSTSSENHKEPDHFRIGVREAHLIRRPLCSFAPVQHANCQMPRLASPSKVSTAFLSGVAVGPMPLSDTEPSTELPVVCRILRAQRCVLFSRQLDVAHPEAD